MDLMTTSSRPPPMKEERTNTLRHLIGNTSLTNTKSSAMKNIVIIIASFLTEINAKGEVFLRVTFLDIASGKKASRLFPKLYAPAYTEGREVEGIEVKPVACEPWEFEGKIRNTRNCVIMKGETDLQGLANTYKKEAIPADLQKKVVEAKKEEEPAIK